MTTTQLHHTASNHVFRLLGRQRAKAQREPGSALGETLKALQEGGESALIEIELTDGSVGRLLVQVGRLVFVQHENSTSEAALKELQREAKAARLYVLRLSAEQIIFACAALAGIPLALGEELGADPEALKVLLEQLGNQSFTGVVALEQGLQTLIWRFQRGRVLNPVALPSRLRAGRLTQIVWQEQLLREIGSEEPRPEVVQATTQPMTAQSTALKPTTPKSTAAQPATPPVQAPTRTAPVETKPVQQAPVQKAPVKGTLIQNASVSPTSARNDPAPQPRSKVQPARSTRQETEEVWNRFQSVLRAQLGNRSERVFSLMRGELGGFSGAELIERLSRQVERIAGPAAATAFRDGF